MQLCCKWESIQPGRLDNTTNNIKIVESYANQTCGSNMQQTIAVVN